MLINLELNAKATLGPPPTQPHTQSPDVQSKRTLYNSQSQIYQLLISNFIAGPIRSGYFGWAQWHAELNDKIYIFQGYPIPFTLRNTGLDYFKHIEDAYEHALMEGEAMRLSDGPLQMIKLV